MPQQKSLLTDLQSQTRLDIRGKAKENRGSPRNESDFVDMVPSFEPCSTSTDIRANSPRNSLLGDETRQRDTSSITPSEFYGPKLRRRPKTNSLINSDSSMEVHPSKESCSVSKLQIVTIYVGVPTPSEISQKYLDKVGERSFQLTRSASAKISEGDALGLKEVQRQPSDTALPVSFPVNRKEKSGTRAGNRQERNPSKANSISQLVTPPHSSPSRNAEKGPKNPKNHDATPRVSEYIPKSRRRKLSRRARQSPVTPASSLPLMNRDFVEGATILRPSFPQDIGQVGEHQDKLPHAMSGQTIDSPKQGTPHNGHKKRKRHQSLPATLSRRAENIGLAEAGSQPSELPMNRPALDQIPTNIVLPSTVIDQFRNVAGQVLGQVFEEKLEQLLADNAVTLSRSTLATTSMPTPLIQNTRPETRSAARKRKCTRKSPNVPENERMSDAELIQLGKQGTRDHRHSTAPYAFNYSEGGLRPNYKHLLDERDENGSFVFTNDERWRLSK